MNKILVIIITLSWFADSLQAADPQTQTPDPQTQTPDSEFKTLFQQADFWQGKQRVDLAKDALNRVLVADPNNIDALYHLALIAIKENNQQAAQKYTDKIKQLSPQSPRLQELDTAKANLNLDSGVLNDARLLAANGKYNEAIQRYQSLFNGAKPFDSLAIEYYQTLAGTPKGWDEARQALKKMHHDQPDNNAAAIAYGEVLTYKEKTRRLGISILAKQDTNNLKATQAWRNALLWLGAKESDRALYLAYTNAHPHDQEVANYYRKKTTLTPVQKVELARGNGYVAYNQGNLKRALQEFKHALSIDKTDAASLAGLGLVQLRRHQFAVARDNLAQAIKLNPNNKEQWQDAYASADLYATLQRANALAEAQKYPQALALLKPYEQGNTKGVRDVALLKADILQKLTHFGEAVEVYRGLLRRDKNDNDARIGLINALQQQGQWQEASAMIASLPKSEQKKLGNISLRQALSLRDRAKSEPPASAEKTLRQAMALAPESPWVRLDLARLLNQTGRPLAAQSLVEASLQSYGTPADKYITALLAQDQARWKDVATLLASIPQAQRNRAMKQLSAKASLHIKLADIKQDQRMGDKKGATQGIMALYNNPPATASGVGEVASILYDAGEPELALSFIKKHPNYSIDAPVGDYVNQVLVLIKAGNEEAARLLLAKLAKRTNLTTEDRTALADIRNAAAIAKADKLRRQGRFAEAYDVLAERLRVMPEDDSLLVAMANLYQSADKGQQALQILQYVLKKNPYNHKALVTAIEVAVSIKQLKTADELMASLPDEQAQNPQILMLAAKVARAHGESDKALGLLAQSRARLFADHPEPSWLTASGHQPDYSNPFAETQAKDTRLNTPSYLIRPAWLPGATTSAQTMVTQSDATEPSLVAQIDQLISDIKKDNGRYLEASSDLTSRNGVAGLGRLDRVEAPVRLNMPFQGGRLTLQATPTLLNSGSLSSEVYQFGSIAIGASAPPPSQHDQGIGLDALQQWDGLSIDMGATPIGFEEVNLIGGVRWQPQLSQDVTLDLNLQRRAIKDSVLSYAGTKDPITGKSWGAITRSGADIGLNYDNKTLALFANLGAYNYQGSAVQSNLALDIAVGGFLRLINNDTTQMNTGVRLTFQSFDKNQSKFSLGHGGYFSPQDYVAIGFPLSFAKSHERFYYKVDLTPGFQTFSEDAVVYFPNDPAAQARLEQAVAAANAEESSYQSNNKSGFGLSIAGQGEYQVTETFLIGAKLGFDNFGDYNKVMAALYLRSLM